MKISKIFIFLKIIKLQGIFEGLNDIFSQSKPTRIECTKVHFVSNKITQRELSINSGHKRSSYEKVTSKIVRVKFWHKFTSRGHKSLLKSLFGAQEWSMEIL
jgi:hypothetical protein